MSRITLLGLLVFGGPRIAAPAAQPANVASVPDRSANVLRLVTDGPNGLQFGGSAVVIGQGFALTAEHCTLGDNTRLIDDRSTPRRELHVLWHETLSINGIDEARVLRIDDATDPLPLGPVPQRGDMTYAYGYPDGRFARLQGEVIEVRPTLIVCDFRGAPGLSGGGLFNARGELIGLCHGGEGTGFSGSMLDMTQTTYIHTHLLQAAVERTRAYAAENYERDKEPPRVIVLTSTGCIPCERLKKDIADGHFPGYEFEVATYDGRLKTWDKPDLYRQFLDECRPRTAPLFPTIWVPGTNKYTDGYQARGGLLTWLRSIIEFLAFGPPQHIPLDRQAPSVDAASEPRAASPLPLLDELHTLRAQLDTLRADVQDFQSSGVIGKIKSVAALKEDKAEILSTVERIKGEVDEVRHDPLKALWGILGGLATGGLHGLLGWRKGDTADA